MVLPGKKMGIQGRLDRMGEGMFGKWKIGDGPRCQMSTKKKAALNHSRARQNEQERGRTEKQR